MTELVNNECDQILDAIPDLIMVLDNEHRIVRANKAVLARYGDGVVGRKCCKFIHGTDDPVAGCPHAEMLRDGREHIAEITENNLGGKFLVSVSPLYDVDGNVHGCVHVARDITERKHAEEAARASQHLLERTFAALADAVFVIDPHTRTVTACNDGVQTVFGYRKDEVVGRNTAFLHVDDSMYADFVRDLFPALDAHGIFKTAFRMRRKDGTVFDSEHTVTEIRDKNGARVGVVSVIHDISKKKFALDALRESEKQYRLLTETIRDAVALETHDGRILYANKRAAELAGIPAHEIGGKYLDDIFSPEQAAFMLRLNREAIASGKPVRKDLYQEFLSRKMWEEANIVPVPDVGNGEPGVLVVSRDITHRKQAEAALEQKNAALLELMEQTAAAKGRISDNIAVNIEDVVLPILSRLRLKGASQKYVDLLEYHLRDIASAYAADTKRDRTVGLTPREKEICDMIKAGLTSKEIAELLALSIQTVQRHRRNIRRRLKLTGTKQNLTSFLSSN